LLVSARYVFTGIAFAILWSSASSAGKIGLESAGGLVLFTARFLLAGIILLAWSLWVRRDRQPRGIEWKQLVIFGAFNTTLYLGIFIVALEEVTAGVTSIALAINPLLISALTARWLGTKVTAIQWISIVIGSVGVVVVSLPLMQNNYASPTGMILMAICMVAYSIGSVYYAGVGFTLSRSAVNGWQVFIGGLLLLPFAVLFPQKENHYDTRFWASVLWLVIPVSIGAVQLWLRLLMEDAVRASLWLFLCPIFGLTFAAVLLNEPITVYTVAGTLLVLLALYLGQRPSKKTSAEG